METTLKKRSPFFIGEKRKMIIREVIISFFILLFMHTATSKIFTFKSFDKVLSEVPMFGSFHTAIAVMIPSLEIIIGALLIVPVTRKIGLYASLILMVIFTIYLSYMVLSMHRLPCSCGGIISHLSWQNHIWLNAGLIVLASFGILTNLNKKQ
ncbi:MauE/DoxX family redox-associated membrane protein [Pedobacter sp. L105]|uniref:MauE/DoxX family redox-associated membrane protein n=1 Tax=Pedobacter sp. L105 TaxID=1641871 RepID=UPI00131B53A8|nr:MauE/DoxX family redox-associated membrane protein [Pedobacter sp. L105]